ncbi:MAG: prepilin-type N-terminal cleavage/methylation domain-containing protein, partial [Pseudohongiellaceae bacterium]
MGESRVQSRNRANRLNSNEKGFTLLEVLVAMTITGMALGGLFGVIAGNKRLAWSSEESLVETMQAR